MAPNRRDVSNTVKKRLRDEAGGKCANPGCPTPRTHLHHIREWAVYETHDAAHMIAVCPTCHDAIHHGDLPITDETIYRWKGITRPDTTQRTHLYIEPGQTTKILLGSIAVSASDQVIVFQLADNNRLSFRIADRDILLVSLSIRRLNGRELLRVTDNHVRNNVQGEVTFRQIPGRVQVRVPATDNFIPSWILALMRRQEPQFAASGEITLLEMEVPRPRSREDRRRLVRSRSGCCRYEGKTLLSSSPDAAAPQLRRGRGRQCASMGRPHQR